MPAAATVTRLRPKVPNQATPCMVASLTVQTMATGFHRKSMKVSARTVSPIVQVTAKARARASRLCQRRRAVTQAPMAAVPARRAHKARTAGTARAPKRSASVKKAMAIQ